jgi:DNA-binding protein H-NS
MPPSGGMFAWVNMVFPDDIDDALPPAAPPPAPLSKRERAVVIDRIASLMQFWGITLDDLTAEPAPEAPPAPRLDLPVKYRHPVSGLTWDGQGAQPDWLRHALVQEGLRVDELRPQWQDAQRAAALTSPTSNPD